MCMFDLQTLTGLLKLDGFEVVEVVLDEARKVYRLVVVSTKLVELCPHCHCLTSERHACHDREVVDLPLGGWKTELTVRTCQFRCTSCRKFFTVRHPALAEGAHATERLLDQLAEWATHADVSAAARFLGIAEKTAEKWYYDYLRRVKKPATELKPIQSMGIDELSLKKKYRQFVCVLIDHTNGRVLDVLESREKEAVIAWLTANKAGLLSELKEATMDMWDAYAGAVKEVFGDSVIVTIDRFHVMKNFQERLNQARREIQNKLSKEQAKELKGSRWLWLTNWQNLKPEQQAELERLKRKFPLLAKLSEHREELRAIFEDGRFRRPESAIAWLNAWCEKGRRMGLKPLEKFNRTMENWMDKIANYFVRRSTNGPTEGFNRGLRAILWRACGMTNFTHFRLRVLHAFG